jgi:hypothetical protein
VSSWPRLQTALAGLLSTDLSTPDLVACIADGVHFAEHRCIVALGIGIDGAVTRTGCSRRCLLAIRMWWKVSSPLPLGAARSGRGGRSCKAR